MNLIKNFSPEFGLVGGTAIALQIGHRKSIDFDLFKNEKLDFLQIKRTINNCFEIEKILVENLQEYTLVVNQVQLTFLHYPFDINFTTPFKNYVKMPSLLELGAMKAYALGKRAKWKDYVDLYFIFQQHSLYEVVQAANHIFSREFSEKQFREQLSFYEDVDKMEQIDFLPEFQVSDEQIKKELQKISVS